MAPHDLVLLVGLVALGVVEVLIYLDSARKRANPPDRLRPSPHAPRHAQEREVPTR